MGKLAVGCVAILVILAVIVPASHAPRNQERV